MLCSLFSHACMTIIGLCLLWTSRGITLSSWTPFMMKTANIIRKFKGYWWAIQILFFFSIQFIYRRIHCLFFWFFFMLLLFIHRYQDSLQCGKNSQMWRKTLVNLISNTHQLLAKTMVNYLSTPTIIRKLHIIFFFVQNPSLFFPWFCFS